MTKDTPALQKPRGTLQVRMRQDLIAWLDEQAEAHYRPRYAELEYIVDAARSRSNEDEASFADTVR